MKNPAMAEAASQNRTDDACPCVRTQRPVTALDLLRANGYVTFDPVRSDEAAGRLCEELDPWFAATPPGQGDIYSCNATRLGAEFGCNYTPFFTQVMAQ